MKKLIFIILLSNSRLHVQSQIGNLNTIMGSVYEHPLKDAVAGGMLIATSAYAEKKIIGIYIQNKYSIQNANQINLSTLLPRHSTVLHFGSGLQGFSSFQLWNISIGEGMKLNESLSLGLKFDLNGIHQPSKRECLFAGYQAGIAYRLNEKTFGHLHFSNQRAISFVRSNPQPGSYTLLAGIGKKMNEKLLMGIDLQKTKDLPTNSIGTIIYQINYTVEILSGISTNQGVYFFGIGWTNQNNKISLVASQHSYLGTSLNIQFQLYLK